MNIHETIPFNTFDPWDSPSPGVAEVDSTGPGLCRSSGQCAQQYLETCTGLGSHWAVEIFSQDFHGGLMEETMENHKKTIGKWRFNDDLEV